MAKITWIKITVDIFDNEKIKLIDSLPDRDCILVMWFKLLALTGKKNESGILYMSSSMPYTDEMLSTLFNRPLSSVRLALQTFESFGMIEINKDKVISIVNWEKYQNVDGMEKIREQNRARKQTQRAKQRVLSDKSTNSHVTSRDSHATELDIELDIDKDKEKNTVEKSEDFSGTPSNNISKPDNKNQKPKKNATKSPKSYAKDKNKEYADFEKAFHGRVLKHCPNTIINEKKREDARNTFRLMVEIDKRTKEILKKAIIFVFDDDFWQNRMQSAKTFREKLNEGKFDQILREGPRTTKAPKKRDSKKVVQWRASSQEPTESGDAIADVMKELGRKYK